VSSASPWLRQLRGGSLRFVRRSLTSRVRASSAHPQFQPETAMFRIDAAHAHPPRHIGHIGHIKKCDGVTPEEVMRRSDAKISPTHCCGDGIRALALRTRCDAVTMSLVASLRVTVALRQIGSLDPTGSVAFVTRNGARPSAARPVEEAPVTASNVVEERQCLRGLLE
jgi:hypothetical protein